MAQSYLAWQRATLLNVCSGLTAEQLAERPVPPSSLSLRGLARNPAKVERIKLRQPVAAQDVPLLYGGAGTELDFKDVDPNRARQESDQLREEWRLADEAYPLNRNET